MKNKNNKLIIILMVIVILLVSVTVFILNYSFDNTSLTIVEKKWVADNSSKMLDVSTYNDVPIFGENGEGIIFDFLDSFTEEYNIPFNKNSYYSTSTDVTYKDISFKVVSGSDKLDSKDIVMYTDYYGLLSSDYVNYKSVSDIKNIKIGVLNKDKDRVSYYVTDDTNEYVYYDKITELVKAIKDKTISYVILPINQYIEDIVSNGLEVDYKFASFSNNYILNVKDDVLYSVFKKYYSKYKNNGYFTDYSKEYLNTYFKAINATEEEKVDYNSRIYKVGYVIYSPFMNGNDAKEKGIILKCLKEFQEIAGLELEFVSYNNFSELENAIKDGTVDVIFNSSLVNDVDDKNLSLVRIPWNREYVILSKKYFNIDSIQGLKNRGDVYTVSDDYLDKIAKSYGIVTKSFKNSDELLRNVDDEAIILIDNITYNYYKNKRLSDYLANYTGTLNSTYGMIFNESNSDKIFKRLLSTYLTLNDFETATHEYADVSYNVTLEQIKVISKYLLILFSVFFIFLVILFILLNKKKKEKLVTPNDKLKYIDILTSLKNRNYLNSNIKKWSSSHRYPQAVIVVDLNNIKYINDNYGHEEGDNVIKGAANILIINQLENSDIMRTDGNEFLIYLLGYDEKQIVSYCHKLFKELKTLPHGFGATVGHSMILDDVKSMEDAINEATIEMRQAKEKMK